MNLPSLADPATGEPVLVVLDAGGTSTRARAVRGGVTVHEAKGGPGNPRVADTATLRASYRDALRGCPPAQRVAAFVAGAGSPRTRRLVRQALARNLVDGTAVTVEPDYVAAWYAAPPATTACVIAGTGSVVCSRAGERWLVSGGRGWLLGDHGGAVRLGQAALSWFVHNESDASPALRSALVSTLFGPASRAGEMDGPAVVSAVYAHAAPARLLARFAPALTAAAEAGEEWAVNALRDELRLLAQTAARHVDVAGSPPAARVAVSGGVWNSLVAVATFAAALADALPPWSVTVTRAADPLDGAVRAATVMPQSSREVVVR